jgi:hypothetical protein
MVLDSAGPLDHAILSEHTHVDAPCERVFQGPSSVNLTVPSSLKQSYASRRAIFFSNDQCFCKGVSMPPGWGQSGT